VRKKDKKDGTYGVTTSNVVLVENVTSTGLGEVDNGLDVKLRAGERRKVSVWR
jgi:hypothetical protein